MKIRSLHTQVNIALLVLTVTLLSQLFSARSSVSALVENQVNLTHSYRNISVVYELERDVIDLQRNLLIYKETGSNSAIQRFHTIMEAVNEQILKLENDVGEGELYLIGKEEFSIMVSHLEDYEMNFSSVITAKAQQESSIETIYADLMALHDYSSKDNSHHLVGIKGNIITIRKTISDYLSTFDPLDIDIFNENISILEKQFKTINYIDGTDKTKEIKREFRRLIQLTRGYMYLVNVVMAGSANEFLFLTKKVRKIALENQRIIEDSAYESSNEIQLINGIISVISILIVLSIAWFLSRKIISPIKNITDVFIVLSKGNKVDSIPNVTRNDEIGDLARAAKVFHENNSLTRRLLAESQNMISIQEVLNTQLEEEKKKAEMAVKSKSDFLANMSHEIRTPMNGIVGLVDLVLQTSLTSKQKRYLERIAYSGKIMMNVINDILDFSKIEAGKMEIESIELDINQIIENVISSMKVRVEEKALDFKVWISPKVPKTLMGDPLRISQILLNLSSNSIKFTEDGSIAIKFDFVDGMLCFSIHDTGIGMTPDQLSTIFDSFTQADDSISRKYGGTGLGLSIVEKLIRLMGGEIKVESNVGVGTDIYLSIPCEVVNDAPLLQPFNESLPTIYYIGRNGKTSAIKYILQGLNVSIEDLSSKKSRDTFMIESLPSPYILFEGMGVVDLPILTKYIESGANLFCILNSNEIEERKELKALGKVKILQHPFSANQYHDFFELQSGVESDEVLLEHTPIPMEKIISGHVLLVEDNQINQLVAGDMLEALGITYELAEDGLQAVDAVKNNHYDLVLMDVQMPKMDGYTATRVLREAGLNDVIICGLSANALKEDEERAEQSGMNDYLTKPLMQDKLRLMLEKYLS
jgi:signal transduction histidine kinase/CheY-like chemotaxis protein/PHD/YefM family antitoxin component YafN of YafNO toxin-antitoxin module